MNDYGRTNTCQMPLNAQVESQILTTKMLPIKSHARNQKFVYEEQAIIQKILSKYDFLFYRTLGNLNIKPVDI